MGIYNTFTYGDGTTYGQISSIKLSVAPFTAVVLKSKVTRLDWVTPSGEYLAIRLVRNQEGLPEHQEDGVVLFTDDSSSVRNYFVDDDEQRPLVDGKHAYYTMWVLLDDFSWIKVGTAFCLLPNLHPEVAPDGTVLKTSDEKFAGLVPKVFSSIDGYTDVVDQESDLFTLLSSMSLLVDEAHTNIENFTGIGVGIESTLNQAIVEAQNYGLTVSPNIGMISLKRLIRQAVSNYINKGTLVGLRSFCSALTRYGVELFISPNLLLSAQDSSFYLDAGDWKSTYWDSVNNYWVEDVSVTVTALNDPDNAAPISSQWTIDTDWYGEVVTTGTNQTISLGNASPLNYAVPVEFGEDYQLSFMAAVPSGSGSVTAKVTWYDRLGKVVGSSVTSSTTSLSSSWTAITGTTLTAPGPVYDVDGKLTDEPAVFAGISLTFSAANTYWVDMLQFADVTHPLFGEFVEARAIEIYLSPDKTNFLSNPSFENLNVDGDIAMWTFAGTATQVASPVDGIYHAEYVANVDTDGLATTTAVSPLVSQTTTHPLALGEFYTFSMYVKCASGTSGELSLYVSAYDSLMDATFGENETIFTPTGDWQRVSVRMFLPDHLTRSYNGVVTTTITCSLFGDTNDSVIQFDSAQLEPSYSMTDYFDGTMDVIGGFYSGDDPLTEEEDDISFLYYNESSKIPTLNVQLQHQLPRNTPYIITVGELETRITQSSGFTQ